MKPLHYAIAPADPAAHLFHVTVTVPTPDPAGQRFMLPAWNPGSYMIREFARHIVRLTALAGERKWPVRKIDKHTWQCAPTTEPLTLAYEVYAWDPSVRAAHLDQTHGFFNGACVFLLPLGHEWAPCTVDILPPQRMDPAWRVFTGLIAARGTRRLGFGTYRAADYDELIDCPVEMGTFTHTSFKVFGVPHEVAITGHVPKLDLKRLSTDLQRVCEAQVALFDPRTKRAPFSSYRFLINAVSNGYGGLEHRNSTALLCKREDLPYLGMKDSTSAYRAFLGLASHEYFHSWNVKRICPAAFKPYDLARENYTALLWAFEGFTAYYDDLMLARCGLLTPAQYLETLSKTLTHVMQRPGRHKQSVAESSFDAWIKYYRADENAPNSLVNYYQKGALVALALDLTLRAQSKGKRSLDDVMRELWRQYLEAGKRYEGVQENGVRNGVLDAIEEVAGLAAPALVRLVRDWTEGTRDPDFVALFKPFGIECTALPALDAPAFAMLGLTTKREGKDLRVASVFDDTPARHAGLSGGDVLVAMDGLRITAQGFDTLIARYAPGDTVELTVFRDDALMRFVVTLATRPPVRYRLPLPAKEGKETRRLRQTWLSLPS